MKTHSLQSRKGFTLVELLVAMAITSIIVVVLISVTSMALDTWNRSRSELRASRQGKAMVDSLARDLESLVIRSGNNSEWLTATRAVPGTGPNGNVSPNASDLIFFNAATDRYNGGTGNGDISCVGYRLAYQDPISANGPASNMTFALYRKLVNPDTTFASLLSQPNLQSAFNAVAGGPIENQTNFICENVYQFTLTFNVDPGTGITTPIVMNTTPFKIYGNKIIINGTDTAGKLKSVGISLTVLTDSGLQQMKKRTFSVAQKAAFVAKNSYEYSKLVVVPGM